MPTRPILAAVPAALVAATWLACADREAPQQLASAPAVPPAGAARSTPAGTAGTHPDFRFVTPLPAGEWRLPAGDYANTRYSPLDQINVSTAKGLRQITSFSTGIPRGHEGQPLVVNDTMYVVTPFPNNLIAMDLRNPSAPVKWVYTPGPSARAVGVACCDIVNRGASYADGKVVYNLLDATTVAVDAETGQEVWRTEVGSPDYGETTTMAPLIVKDVVLVGNSGGELGVRGWVKGLDLGTGRVRWTAYHTGPDEEVLIGPGFNPFYPKDQGDDLGVKTWPPDQWKLGGSTAWGWISYDPELDLFFYGTGNPGVWNPDLRPGDNKWSITIWARDPDDGFARWAYQVVPHDAWDYDEIMENIVVDMRIEGRMRKVLIHPGRTGFVFVIDRESGQLISTEKFMPVNWAEGYDLLTGLPLINEAKRTHMGQVTTDICPSSTGAKEWVPSALSARTGLLYIPAHNTCMTYEGIEANYIAGTPYLGASVRMYPGPGDFQGELVAWDPIRQRKVWGVREPVLPVYSGVLATGGDVVFYGTMDGWFKALNAWTGEELWRYKLASGIVGCPMTFLGPDGRQYVAIYAGIGGWMGAVAFPAISIDDPFAALGVVGAMQPIKKFTNPGGVVYVFGL